MISIPAHGNADKIGIDATFRCLCVPPYRARSSRLISVCEFHPTVSKVGPVGLGTSARAFLERHFRTFCRPATRVCSLTPTIFKSIAAALAFTENDRSRQSGCAQTYTEQRQWPQLSTCAKYHFRQSAKSNRRLANQSTPAGAMNTSCRSR